MPEEVFISYGSADRERIQDLVSRLRQAGVTVWIDEAGIEGAAMWSEEIVGAINHCKILILAISSNSTKSKNVVRELALASEEEKNHPPSVYRTNRDSVVDEIPVGRHPTRRVFRRQRGGSH